MRLCVAQMGGGMRQTVGNFSAVNDFRFFFFFSSCGASATSVFSAAASPSHADDPRLEAEACLRVLSPF